MKEQFTKPLGLITRPNQYGEYGLGACSVLQNAAMRSPGLLESLPASRSYRAAVITDTVIRKLHPAAASALAISDEAVAWASDTAVTAVSMPSKYSFVLPDGIVDSHQARGRFFVAGQNGVLALDSEGDSSARPAGLPPPYAAYFGVSRSSTLPTSLIYGNTTVWAVVIVRKFTDGYLVRGAPSAAIQLDNDDSGHADVTPNIIVDLGKDVWPGVFAAGDIVELYRSRQLAIGNDPGDTLYLSTSYALTSADIAAGYVAIDDIVTDDGLGAELYSNPGQEGGDQVNLPPPVASNVVTFKGHTLYASPSVQPSQGVRVPGALGILSSDLDRRSGIGSRAVTGNTTLGSPNITSVSDTTGIVAGQYVSPTNFTLGSVVRVLSVSGSTVTVDRNASATGTGASFAFQDMIQVNGVWYPLYTSLFLGAGYQFLTGNTHSGTPNITSVSDTRFLAAGMALAANAYFPAFTTIVSVSGTTVVMSANATATSPGAELTFELVKTDAYVQSDTPLHQTVAGNTTPIVYGADFDFLLPYSYINTDVTLRATNGQNYAPALPSASETAAAGTSDPRGNRFHSSKLQQPEAVPPLNYTYVGSGTIYRIWATRDCVWAFCSDGLFRISGDAYPWRVDPVDPGLILATRSALGILDNTLWAYTNRGLVPVNSDGPGESVSHSAIGDPEHLPGAYYSDSWNTFLACDQYHREVWLTLRNESAETSLSYVYNAVTSGFYTVSDDAQTALAYSGTLQSLVLATPAGDVRYFQVDDSTTRMAGARVVFQPFYGGDPSAEKEFIDVYYTFAGFLSAAVLTPSFTGVDSTNVAIAASAVESRVRVPVPRDAPAVSPRLTPGFHFASGDTGNRWALRGVALSFEPLSDEVAR